MCLWSVSSFTIPHLASPVPFTFTFTHSFTTSCLLCHQVRLLIAKGATINARNGCPSPALTNKNYRCVRGSAASRTACTSCVAHHKSVTRHTSHVTRHTSHVNICHSSTHAFRMNETALAVATKNNFKKVTELHAQTLTPAHTHTNVRAHIHTGDKVAQGKGRDLVRMGRVK